MQTGNAFIKYSETLSKIYGADEARAITALVFENVFKISKAKIFANSGHHVETGKQLLLEEYLKRLINDEPVQYVLGETEFCGLKFKVNSNVLIPRPETEELVDWIVSDLGRGKKELREIKILDVGTGSGCIAIALKKKIPGAEIFALDISKPALEVAAQNAELNNAAINFIEANILQPETLNLNLQSFHLVVSNPPYVRESEKIFMKNNVLRYEPPLALFVNDNDALIFYRCIAALAGNYLLRGGKLFLEINETSGNEITALLKNNNFENVILKKDFSGKDRMIAAEIKN